MSGTSTTAASRPLVSSPAREGARRARSRWTGLVYVAPALAVYGVFTLLPALHTVYLSLFDWDGIAEATWVGLGNYADVFTDPTLRASIVHALILIVFFSLLPVAIGLALVGLLAHRRARGLTVYRVLFFLPYVLPLVAVGVTWRWMYSGDGTVNQILGAVGLDGLTRAWLGDFTLALPAIGLIGTWTLTGFCMTLFLAGAQKIDGALYEAARIDGAGPVQEFRAVTLPALRGEISLALIVTTIAALATFDIVFVTTNGAPADRTTVPGLLVYRLAFNDGQVGQACALAVVLTALVLLVVGVLRRLSRPKVEP
jgi:ABC-type sugar transport system permease subunit